jgi:peptidyl-prolyl cis-trans isomerase C
MFNFKTILLGCALGVGMTVPGIAQDVTADTVVASVGDTDITIGHMIALTSQLNEDQLPSSDAELFNGVLERLVQQETVAQAMTEPTRFVELQLENERRALLASEMVNGLAQAIDVSDEAVQAAYDARFADFTPSTEYNASHILVGTEDEAKAVITELDAGGDFAELAKEKSTGPSGPGGGSLGWFGPGRMVPAFEAAVVALQPGEVSVPVETQFGWHVIKLNETRVPEVPSLAQMAPELQQEVFQLELRTNLSEIIDAAQVERADVSGIDPSVVRDLSLIQN